MPLMFAGRDPETESLVVTRTRGVFKDLEKEGKEQIDGLFTLRLILNSPWFASPVPRRGPDKS